MRKFDLKQPIHRIGQSVVYYDSLDSMVDKCRSMQGVKGIDGTVIFANRIRINEGDISDPTCSFGVIVKPDTLPFKERAEVEPVMMGAFASVLEAFQASFRWPSSFVRDGVVFGQARCVAQKIKERWVYIIFSAQFDFGEGWSIEEQEAFLQASISALDQMDRRIRESEDTEYLADYRRASNLMEQRLKISLPDREIEGIVQEITAHGDLIVKQNRGRAIRVPSKKIKTIQYLDVASQ